VKLSTGTFLGMFVPYELLTLAGAEDATAPEGGETASASSQKANAHDWAFIVDFEKCIGCGKCTIACKLDNNVPLEPHFNRTWIERYAITDDGEALVDSPDAGMHGFPDNLAEKYPGVHIRDSFFIPKLCNQCDTSPCVQVCPVSATYKTDDGVVLVDRERCIGCRYCIQACPYGTRYLHPDLKIVDKCTWCYHRISKGLNPACVEACPADVRIFGDRNDPESRVSRILREEKVYVLKPGMHTRPRVFYINLPREVN
jgi:Fe-S-cluster-containing dehydrogenase component